MENVVNGPPCYIESKINESEQDIERFSRRFNGSQNKGYLYAASLIELRKNKAAKCLSGIYVAVDVANIEWLILEQE